MSHLKNIKRVTTHILQSMKAKGEKITMLTAYDYSMAKIIDDASIDIILVGDYYLKTLFNQNFCRFNGFDHVGI